MVVEGGGVRAAVWGRAGSAHLLRAGGLLQPVLRRRELGVLLAELGRRLPQQRHLLFHPRQLRLAIAQPELELVRRRREARRLRLGRALRLPRRAHLRLRLLAQPGALGVGGARVLLLRRHPLLAHLGDRRRVLRVQLGRDARVLLVGGAEALRLLRRERRRLLQLPRAQRPLLAEGGDVRLEVGDASGEVLLDRAVVPRDEAQREVGDLAEGVDLGEREHRRAAQRRERRDEPRVLLGVRRLAVAQQLDELEREGREVDEDRLLGLERVELVLRDVERVQQERVALVRQLHVQHLLVSRLRHAVRERDRERRRAVLAVGVLEHHRHNARVDRLRRRRRRRERLGGGRHVLRTGQAKSVADFPPTQRRDLPLRETRATLRRSERSTPTPPFAAACTALRHP